MARTSSSDCSTPSFATVGCAPGVSKRLPLSNVPLMLQGLQDANYIDGVGQGQTVPVRLPCDAAPGRDQERHGLRRGDEVGDAYVLVWPVGVAHVPGAVHHARRLPATYREA